MSNRKPLSSIPTHIFMGFLGSGKTSAILNLFKQKPASERWAVLVNEYGKLGIDGALYQSQQIYVKEIPGGCMCCAAGVPMQVAINQLLRRSRPDRLFIETSGLGHPMGVMKTLRSPYFESVLSLKASICLLDPEKLLSPNLYGNELFQQQMVLADILVANKVDLASKAALKKFDEFKESFSIPKLVVAQTSHGRIDASWLSLKPVAGREKETMQLSAVLEKNQPDYAVISESFANDVVFSIDKLTQMFIQQDTVRIKAICRVNEGWVIINGDQQHVTINGIEQQQESHFDVIVGKKSLADEISSALRNCIQ